MCTSMLLGIAFFVINRNDNLQQKKVVKQIGKAYFNQEGFDQTYEF